MKMQFGKLTSTITKSKGKSDSGVLSNAQLLLTSGKEQQKQVYFSIISLPLKLNINLTQGLGIMFRAWIAPWLQCSLGSSRWSETRMHQSQIIIIGCNGSLNSENNYIDLQTPQHNNHQFSSSSSSYSLPKSIVFFQHLKLKLVFRVQYSSSEHSKRASPLLQSTSSFGAFPSQGSPKVLIRY